MLVILGRPLSTSSAMFTGRCVLITATLVHCLSGKVRNIASSYLIFAAVVDQNYSMLNL